MIGEVLQIARIAAGMTQEELAERAGVTQAALSRYEHDLREPDQDALALLAGALGVTPALLGDGGRVLGGMGVGAHMRRRATARASVWKQLEAQLNMVRIHAQTLSAQMVMAAQLQLPSLDPDDPAQAAQSVRLQWRMPSGPVRSVMSWLESAGVLVVERDFGGSARVDGLSQWGDGWAVVLLNSAVPTDRKRWTLAHELGHLVLHGQRCDGPVEDEANEFAEEFLMPTVEIKPDLRAPRLGTLRDLKLHWGVSIAALIKRASSLGQITAQQQTSLQKQLSARGWRVREPGSDDLTPETPKLAAHIADSFLAKGLSEEELAQATGFAAPSRNDVFQPTKTGPTLRLVT
jgi:Zn-dependent peptidase ImmA (M78 family)/transcriptional regulator with XRE-family HTH domain